MDKISFDQLPVVVAQMSEDINWIKSNLFTTPEKEEIENISGSKAAVNFLNSRGYTISFSLFSKRVAKGDIPCRRFCGKVLLFSSSQLIEWAENMCTPLGQSGAALILAESANRKLRGGRK